MTSRHTSRIALLAISTVAMCMFSSCGKQDGKLELAFVTNNPANFWEIARKGVQKAEKEFNLKCEFKTPANGAAGEQQTLLDDLMSKGVAGISISPVDPKNQVQMLDKVSAAMPLLCHDSDAPDSKRLCYVGTNNINAGHAAGKLIKAAIPEGGKIMLFVGTLDAQNARDRRQGIMDELSGTEITIIDTRTDNADGSKAKANVEDTIVKYPDVKCLVGLWGYNGPAIASAIKDAKLTGKIKAVCFDEDNATLQAIQEGVVYGTVVQRPFEMGYQSMRILAAYIRGDKTVIPADKNYDTGIVAVAKENVDSFWAELKNLLK